MMKLYEISINNFKGIRSGVFKPNKFSCLVGENNAGKSTVLQALVYALNRPKNIPETMFYDSSYPIIFKQHFEGILSSDLNRLKVEHRNKLAPHVYDGKLTLISKYTVTDGLELLIHKKVPREERYKDEAIKANFAKKTTANQSISVIEDNYPEHLDGLPDGAKPPQAKEYLANVINNFSEEQFEYVETALPSGISSSISALLPEPIYIPAVKNFEDDLKTTQSTNFGRLMGLLMEEMKADLEDINDTLVDLNKRLNRYTDGNDQLQDERLPKVKNLESTIQKYLSENFPNVSVELEIPPPEIKTILNTASIFIDDGSRDLIENKGDGVKRSLTFSLLRAYVEILSRRNKASENALQANQVSEKPLIFLFEEPELYLHPKAQRILFSTLASISDSYQTVITTHSPLFFEPGVTAQFIRINKEIDENSAKPVGKLYPVDFAVDQEKLNTFRMAKFHNSEAAFFSNHIVLYEGESDDFFFRHIAKTLNTDWCFFSKNISLVEVGGKGNFAKFRSFFEAFGLKVSIICDLDVITEGFQHLGASSDIIQKRSELLDLLNKRTQELKIKSNLSGKRVKNVVKKATWLQKYERAKDTINSVVENGTATKEQLDIFSSLFEWEDSEGRYNVLSEDVAVKPALVEVLDLLRNENIYILCKGAIEEYYPKGIESHSKSERALKVNEYITSNELARELSEPLSVGRDSEFEEIFSSMFS